MAIRIQEGAHGPKPLEEAALLFGLRGQKRDMEKLCGFFMNFSNLIFAFLPFWNNDNNNNKKKNLWKLPVRLVTVTIFCLQKLQIQASFFFFFLIIKEAGRYPFLLLFIVKIVQTR